VLKKLLLLLILIGIVVLSAKVFIPRNYPVPKLEMRAGTQYWDLPTGSKIAYTLIPGKNEKKPFPIIFLQGGPGAPIYKRNIELLSPLAENGYDVYLYDQVGCGFSRRLDDITEYTAERHKQDWECIVEKIGADKVILIGQSWGAILAVMYLAENSGKAEKIIFTGPGPILPVNQSLANAPVPDSLHFEKPEYTNAMANNQAQNMRTWLMKFCALKFGKKLAFDEEADNFQTYLDSFLRKSTYCDTLNLPPAEPGGGYYCQIMTVKSFNQINGLRQKLAYCPIPILVIKGECDNQPWGFTNEYLQIFKNCKLIVLIGEGHNVSASGYEIYIKSILNFLQSA
jgi:proline iminopeptidase